MPAHMPRGLPSRRRLQVAAWPVVAATLLISGRLPSGHRGAASSQQASSLQPLAASPGSTAAGSPPLSLPAAIGLVLPYTPVGALEGMVALPPSFYAWVAATIAGAGWQRPAGPRTQLAACCTCRHASLAHAQPLHAPSCTSAAYAATVQLAKRLYIRRFGGWL